MTSEQEITNSEEETINAGIRFAKKLHPGDTVALFGTLGSGKTEFIKGICHQFHVTDIVSSPTFTIMNQYTGSDKDSIFQIYHIDLYRIKNKLELAEIGFSECLDTKNAIKFIEWAEKANGMLPSKRFDVKIECDVDIENRRNLIIEKI
ncbi:MAG: hypothetical protein HW421_2259 [Ignavibacteria bacterium]|nr:hypothetical protein [Ignavibacteria bacterium]